MIDGTTDRAERLHHLSLRTSNLGKGAHGNAGERLQFRRHVCLRGTAGRRHVHLQSFVCNARRERGGNDKADRRCWDAIRSVGQRRASACPNGGSGARGLPVRLEETAQFAFDRRVCLSIRLYGDALQLRRRWRWWWRRLDSCDHVGSGDSYIWTHPAERDALPYRELGRWSGSRVLSPQLTAGAQVQRPSDGSSLMGRKCLAFGHPGGHRTQPASSFALVQCDQSVPPSR